MPKIAEAIHRFTTHKLGFIQSWERSPKYMTFNDLNLNKQLLSALDDLALTQPTTIQEKVFSVVMSGKDVCGIAQTGTGKTFAYLLPCLRQFQFSKDTLPQLLIIVPTRELVVQVVEAVEKLSKYLTLRVVGVYGGVNLKPQAAQVALGVDVLVGTPGRLMDLLSTGVLKPKSIKKLVIDEFDEMLNLGFRAQLKHIFDQLPARRQNLLFSATITPEVEQLIDIYFTNLVRVEATPVGTPLDNIVQTHYRVPNFYTKINLLKVLLTQNADMSKVLVFASTKSMADLVYEQIVEQFSAGAVNVIHSNKSQNHRFGVVQDFDAGICQVLIATDVIARGLDVAEVTHVVNFDLPDVPEIYVHRIGRTGRVGRKGIAFSFVIDKEAEYLTEIEKLMNYIVPASELPDGVEISERILFDEQPKIPFKVPPTKKSLKDNLGPAFHDKSEKNSKVNVRRNHVAEKKKKYGRSYENRNRE